MPRDLGGGSSGSGDSNFAINTSGFELITAESADVIGVSGGTFLYDNTNPASGSIAINGAAYYDEGAYRYVSVDIFLSEDSAVVLELSENLIPEGGEIVSTNLQSLGASGQYVALSTIDSAPNRFALNRLDTIDNQDIDIRVWLKISNPASVSLNLPIDVPVNNSGVQNLDALRWNAETRRYEPMSINQFSVAQTDFNFSTTTLTKIPNLEFNVKSGQTYTFQFALKFTVLNAAADIRLQVTGPATDNTGVTEYQSIENAVSLTPLWGVSTGNIPVVGVNNTALADTHYANGWLTANADGVVEINIRNNATGQVQTVGATSRVQATRVN